MTEKQPAPHTSAVEYAFAGGNILLSSERAAWAGLTAKYYRGPRDYASSLPVFVEDVIALLIHDTTYVTGKLVRPFCKLFTSPGSSYFIPKGEPSEWHSSDACDLLHLYLDPTFFAMNTLGATDIDLARVELIAHINQHDPLVYQIGMALLGELQSGGPLGRLYVETLGQALAVHLLRSHVVFPQQIAEPKGGLAQPVLRTVLAYIEEHLARELALADIAGQARMSQYHFARLFRQSMGCSLHQYVAEQRLERAKGLLVGGKHSIAEVAALTGFVDQSHLHRYFKRRYGVTPGAALGHRTNIQSMRTNIQDESDTDPLG